MRCSRVHSRSSEKESHSSETYDEVLSVLELNLAQARPIIVQARLYVKKKELKIFIFAFENLMYYCLVLLSKQKLYRKK